MKSTVTTAIILETRFKKKDDDVIDPIYPVKLRVTYQKKQKYYILIHPETKKTIELTKEDFKRTMGTKARDDFKKLQTILYSHEQKAIDAYKDLSEFSWTAFELKYLNQRSNLKDLLPAFDDYAKTLSEIGTATGYMTAKNSFKDFGGDKLKFEDVTKEWLEKYEKWMLAEGNTKTTVGFYCRNLRRVLNKAIENKLYRIEDYPFGKNKYQIPTSSNKKKALNTADLTKIFNYNAPKGSEKETAKDYWLFSYLGNGINPKDIFLLKWKDKIGNEIHYSRAKTKRSRNAPSKIVITITKEINEILNRQGNKNKDQEDYIFPVLKKGQSAKEQFDIRQKQVKFINKYIREIAKDLKIKSDITTYVARHSFASVLLHQDVNIGFISESLGHSTITTTQKYLKSFPEQQRKKYASLLTNFSKKKS